MSEVYIHFSGFNELHCTILLEEREVCYDQTQVIGEDRGVV